MRIPWIAAACLAALPATAALADDDCHAPRAAWQPREAAMQAASRLGWRVEEIEADDGCWEIEGRDAEGRRIKAKLDPEEADAEDDEDEGDDLDVDPSDDLDEDDL